MSSSDNSREWFFVEDPGNEVCRKNKLKDTVSSSEGSSVYDPRKWLFRVRAPELKPDEALCVVGNIIELGRWNPEKGYLLEREDDSDVWSSTVQVPLISRIEYRYCVVVVIEKGMQVIVRNWEAGVKPRVILQSDTVPTNKDEPSLYGQYEDIYQIDRGWLIKETMVQLKLCNSPLTLFKPKYNNRAIFIKVTPVNLLKHNTNIPKTMSEALEESLSAETQDQLENPKHAYTEVASLISEDPIFKPQNQFGHEYKSDDLLIFQSSVLFPSNTAYLIDLYVYSSSAHEGEPPYHAGFSYLLPTVLQGSEGKVTLPVTSTKHRPLGQITLEYLVISPMTNFKCDMSVTYERHWKKGRQSLDVGHRGSGSSFKVETKNCAEVRENTIASLRNAINHGADFVEFDVQLSKDLVPIIYHDFHICISMKKKKDLIDGDMLEIPVKELTYDQLRLLKVYHLSEGKSMNPRYFNQDEQEEHQPFPTLQQALEVLNPHVGFNIEIKWTMQMADGTYELYHPYDLNLYLDTILEVVLRYGKSRRIVFSCFNPDICQVIRLKQNKYPVVFLTVGESEIYDKYADPRCWSIKSAAQYSIMSELLGINVHTEDLLRDASLIKYAHESNLVIFCWGDANADPATIKYLKQLGVHGVIFDKIYQYSSKDVKESVFMVEARESQKDLIRMVAASAETQSIPPQHTFKDIILDVDSARKNMVQNLSTATSLESLETQIGDYRTS